MAVVAEIRLHLPQGVFACVRAVLEVTCPAGAVQIGRGIVHSSVNRRRKDILINSFPSRKAGFAMAPETIGSTLAGPQVACMEVR